MAFDALGLGGCFGQFFFFLLFVYVINYFASEVEVFLKNWQDSRS